MARAVVLVTYCLMGITFALTGTDKTRIRLLEAKVAHNSALINHEMEKMSSALNSTSSTCNCPDLTKTYPEAGQLNMDITEPNEDRVTIAIDIMKKGFREEKKLSKVKYDQMNAVMYRFSQNVTGEIASIGVDLNKVENVSKDHEAELSLMRQELYLANTHNDNETEHLVQQLQAQTEVTVKLTETVNKLAARIESMQELMCESNSAFCKYVRLLSENGIDWNTLPRFKSSVYYYDDSSSMDWSDADTKCKSLGGYLVELNSYDEMNFIDDHVVEYQVDSVWTGGKMSAAGTWTWTHSGQTVKQERLTIRIHPADCISLHYRSLWSELFVRPCYEIKGVVCEFDTV